MKAREFYSKRLKEDETIGTVQLMEEYAKHIIATSLCDGAPIHFSNCTIEELNRMHNNVNFLVGYANS